MQTIDFELLATVTGGAESTSSSSGSVSGFGVEGRVSSSSTTTDNESCRRDVRQACDSANPGVLFGTNSKASAQCFLQNFPKCPE